MHITCEHCGSTIDLDKDKTCPNCGAPYHDNKEYKEVKNYHSKNKDYDLREREANIHSKELANKVFENTVNGVNTGKKFVLFIITIIIIIMAVAVYFQVRSFNRVSEEIHSGNDYDEEQQQIYDQLMDKLNKENEKVEVEYNETAVTASYDITCDKVKSYKYNSVETEKYRGDNIDYYKFHVTFKNKTSRSIYLGDFILTYTDDNGNENIVAKEVIPNITEYEEKLDFSAPANLTSSGYTSFAIPKYVQDVKLLYNNVTINIPGFRAHIDK